MEWRRKRIPGVRHPDGMVAEKDSGCGTPGWNELCHASRGGRPRAREREPRVIFLGRISQVGESLERETGLVDRMDMEAWVSGFNGYAKGWWTACTRETPCKWDGE